MNTSELGAQLLLSDTYISVMAKGFTTLFPLTTSVSQILFRRPFCGRARPENAQCTPTSSAISLSRGQLHLVPSSHPVSFILFALSRTLPLYRSIDTYDCRIVQDDWMILHLVFLVKGTIVQALYNSSWCCVGRGQGDGSSNDIPRGCLPDQNPCTPKPLIFSLYNSRAFFLPF